MSATNREAIVVHTQTAIFAEISRQVLLVFGIAITGVARIFVWGGGGHPADATQPCISRAHV